MGLGIAVGLLSWLEAEDPEGADFHRETLAALDAVLAEAGLPEHAEPTGLAAEDVFEAQMWGYGGLHCIRRLAAHWDLTGKLPPPARDTQVTDDPVVGLYHRRSGLVAGPRRRGLAGWFQERVRVPRYLHLMAHSDCEGFYIPRDLPGVILDRAEPPRAGVGGMVGSSVALAREVAELCAALGIPADLDPEDEAVWENAENPPAQGAPWERHGIETFGLTRLRRACDLSIRTGSAVVFT
jgi:hypothetical protein